MEKERYLVELHKKLQRERKRDIYDLQTARMEQHANRRRQLETMWVDMKRERDAMFDERQRDLNQIFDEKARHQSELHDQIKETFEIAVKDIRDLDKQHEVVDFRKLYNEKMADFEKVYEEKMTALFRQHAQVEALLNEKQDLQREAFAKQGKIEEEAYVISYHELVRARLDPYPERKREIARRSGA